MLNDTWPEYSLIRTVVFFLQSIGPLCTGYAFSILFQALLTTDKDVPILQIVAQLIRNVNAFQWYCFAEAAFYLFFRWYRLHLQREAIHPPLRSQADRKALFEKVRSEIHDPRKFLSGWFRGANIEDIGRDDLKEFLSWAFWEGRTTEDDQKELEELTRKVEDMMGQGRFKPGRGTAKGLRLTLDPIEMDHRSLLWYTLIALVDTTTHLRLLRYGFQYHSTPPTSFAIFPPRPLAHLTSTGPSPSPHLSYWLRPHTSSTRLPILYLHGIGVGLHPHVEFLHEQDRALNASSPPHDQVGILCLEVPQISSRLTAHPILPRSEFLVQLRRILDQHRGFERFVLLSHSYGSVLSTHILTDDAMAGRVAAALLVDPVTVLLHMPDVAYNFTVRRPRKANEWQLWYFASKDPGVSHVLGRHFFWSQNVLWRDRLQHLVQQNRMRITASLARRDLIVDTEAVGAYLMQDHVVPDPVLRRRDGRDGVSEREGVMGLEVEGQGERKKQEWKEREFVGKGLEVLWWDELDHAQVFDVKETREKLVRVLVEYCRDSK
ncbi:hypothetical protein KC332_g306 [Hortaea werneckii]|uniref:AB hydrolase-1 domain-containing protein n=1 Tax=Hortaea werneckii TaxID=91943 RepID=A0A3M7ITE1_HORWE|nr:hypothetical protein KC358_g426 [Hortaea werneckii]KAI6852877.1 hypothetical protein KC350_g475 [Hortaea werneckii]KAI6944790.1 hypothetical protein KC341_g552 [Hortaea werneckii]KAI6950954.1 hypothetical protein KC348_g333 [Hortaea werneckii]KAI6982873.1 hypothetical protein KC321_g382 [Hortaea werneckii]